MKCLSPARKPHARCFSHQALVLFLASMLVLLTSTLIAEGREHPLPTPSHAMSESSLYAQPQAFETLSPTIALDIPLGNQQTVEIELTNITSTTLTPRLYEAWQEPPPGITFPLTGTASTQELVLPDQQPRIDPQIWADLAAAPDNRTEFFVYLQDYPDLSHAYGIRDWSERGWYVYQTLRRHAAGSQQDIRAWLDEQHISYQPFWIVNALAVEGTAADLQALEARADVAYLRANELVSLGVTAAPSAISSCKADDQGICWNIKQINAHRVWKDYGVSGQGITIAHIDSGVNLDHPALVQQYRGYRGEATSTHAYNWYDPVNKATSPNDAGNHGTHTMGTMVARGDGTLDQPTVGVAPGVRWIAARGCGSTTCKETNLVEAAEWLIAPTNPDGETPRPDLRPHIINNSWASAQSDSSEYRELTAAWRAAGIFPVFSAGNTTSIACGSITSPGDYANVVGVGATTSSDSIAYFSRVGPSYDNRMKPDITAPGDSIVSTFAGNGYGTLNGTSMASPHVAATVALLWSANPALIADYDTTYDLLTSTAIPRIDNNYTSSRFDACKANTIPNSIYGYGRIDAYAGVTAARVDVPWLTIPATLPTMKAGETITFAATIDARQFANADTYHARILVSTGDLQQTPLAIAIEPNATMSTAYATIQGRIFAKGTPLTGKIAVKNGPETIIDNTTDSYQITLPVTDTQPYTLTASSTGYVSQTQAITVEKGNNHTLNFTLSMREPHIKVMPSAITTTLSYREQHTEPITITNVGTLPLNYSATIPMQYYAVSRSDQAKEGDTAAYTWRTLPKTANTLSLGDDAFSKKIDLPFDFPIDGAVVNALAIGSNGVMVFDTIKPTEGFYPRCQPVPETVGRALMPLRADLDPSYGGSIRYGEVDNGFLITYEDIALHEKPDKTFTFQVFLTSEGDVTYTYKDVAIIPDYVSVGIQLSEQQAQVIGCDSTLDIASGLTIQFRPNPSSSQWVSLAKSMSDGESEEEMDIHILDGTLEPGKQTVLALNEQWVFTSYVQPYQSRVEISSDDPDMPSVTIPISVSMLPLTHAMTLPMEADFDFTTTQGLTFRIVGSADVVDEEMLLVYTEIPTPTLHPSDYRYAGHAFRLRAYRDQQELTDFVFTTPLAITLEYDDTTMQKQEDVEMMLFNRIAGEKLWLKALPALTSNPADNRVTLQIEQPGEFGLYYQQQEHNLYIPLVQRSR